MNDEELSSAALPRQRSLRLRLRNPLSLAGLAVGLVALVNIVVFVLIGAFGKEPSPYIGIVAYVVAPGFLILGLLLTAIGLLLERGKKLSPTDSYPKIDFNDPRQRSALITFVVSIVVFSLASIAGSYRAYEFTESVQFCGQTCHTVMGPEFTAYHVSAHARVACVECHVGSGPTWYMKSKISGVRQLYALAAHSFPRPIPTPVHNMRPANDTCEQCHWPKKFYGKQLKTFTHYSSDEKNTVHQVQLLIDVGGGDPLIGTPEGIHWHMNLANRIDYVAVDEKRQVIPYVRVQEEHGQIREYYAQDSKLTRDQIAKVGKHRMDCIDCHNRPTHIFVPPDQAIDESLQAHRLDASLPSIKAEAVALLSDTYPTTDAGVEAIAGKLNSFYLTKYPDVAKSKQAEIRAAALETQQIFRRTSFPEMKTNWQSHADNLGHYYYSGCFRCHDGQHLSADGKAISKDCNLCHTVLSQNDASATQTLGAPRSFQHPVDLGDLTQVNCSDCHTGGSGP